jgi:hypothetical protein
VNHKKYWPDGDQLATKSGRKRAILDIMLALFDNAILVNKAKRPGLAALTLDNLNRHSRSRPPFKEAVTVV